MEADLQQITSESLNKPYINTILHTLKDVQDEAIKIRETEIAQNPELRRALLVVEYFLRKTKRLCYGGMAINAHLPASLKFYDFSKTIPDYDFFTPTPEKDVEYLIKLLEHAGFESIVKRFGIHEGTYKIFVNYHGVADITFMASWLYDKLFKTSIQEDKIHYVDANYLRMSMYLELSRPRGEVERWDKVYKRLLQLNLVKPVGLSRCKRSKKPITILSSEVYKKLIEYTIDNKFIFCGAEIATIYEKNTGRAGFIFKKNYPLIVYTEKPLNHLAKLRHIILSIEPNTKLDTIHWERFKDIVPEMYGIKINGKLSMLILEEYYCFGYNTVIVPSYGKMLIASLDTAITLYYTLAYLRNLDELVPNSVECFAHRLVEISKKTRDKNDTGVFPLFSETCQGHQPTKETLLKAKAKRIEDYKKGTRNNKTNGSILKVRRRTRRL